MLEIKVRCMSRHEHPRSIFQKYVNVDSSLFFCWASNQTRGEKVYDN